MLYTTVALWSFTAFLLALCNGNQMDPHVYPSKGPFFEGWYLRVTDTHKNASLGFLFGLVLPERAVLGHEHLVQPYRKQNEAQSLPLAYSSLLISLNGQQKLETPTGLYSPDQYKVTQDGEPVKHNPDDKTPPHFEASIANNISFVVTPTGTKFSIGIGDHIFKGETTAPVPWGPDGEGPESWLEKLPLPIHWFVYSLRSTVKYYDYTNTQTGVKIVGGTRSGAPVVAHMEKNWGKSFPKAWIWAEGVDPSSNVSFAISSGVITELDIDIKAQLSGYRNPSKGIHCSFHPANSVHELTYDGCAGTATFMVESLECSVTFQLSAPPESFSACLLTPQIDGFKKGCVESYRAVADITVYQRRDFSMVLTDKHVINLAALEFGEQYMCNGKCPSV